MNDVMANVIQAQKKIIDGLAACEDSIARLYTLYSESIPELQAFFADLARKETMHANLLRTMHKQLERGAIFQNIGRFNEASISSVVKKIQEDVHHAEKFSVRPEYAVEVALSIECSFVDAHFYDLVQSDAPEYVIIAERLSRDTEEHVRAVREKLRQLQEKSPNKRR